MELLIRQVGTACVCVHTAWTRFTHTHACASYVHSLRQTIEQLKVAMPSNPKYLLDASKATTPAS